MEINRRYMVEILLVFLYLYSVHAAPADEKKKQKIVTDLENSNVLLSDRHHTKILNKRSTDWSKRITSHDISKGSYIAAVAESEKVEVTSKPPTVVRRMRIQHGDSGRHGVVKEFKEQNFNTTPPENGGKLIKVKKFKRKPARKTTPIPQITTTSGTSKTFTRSPQRTPTTMTLSSRPFTKSPQITSTTILSSIPFIKSPQTTPTTTSSSRLFTKSPQITPTTAATLRPLTRSPQKTTTITTSTARTFTSTPKGVSSSPFSHITVINKIERNPKRNRKRKNKTPTNLVLTTPVMTEARQNRERSMYGTPSPDVRGRTAFQQGEHIARHFSSYPDSVGNYGGGRIESPRRKRKGVSSYEKENEKHHTGPQMNVNRTSHEPVRMPHSKPSDVNKLSKIKSSMLKEEVHHSLTRETAEKSSGINENVNGREIELRSSKSSTEYPHEKEISVQPEDKKVNKTSEPPQPLDVTARYPYDTRIQNADNMKPIQQRLPSHYPSYLYDRFSDPFFHTPEVPAPVMHGPYQGHPLMNSPFHHPFSTFYSPNDPRSSFGGGMLPYQSDEVILPSFHHSPQLQSLRRSILDNYEEDQESSSEPVTPFSLPKFEIPAIDFNDKGCRTVYKEVKVVPRDGSRTEKENKAKSFIMSRECYFPNGVPTPESAKETDTTSSPVVVETKRT